MKKSLAFLLSVTIILSIIFSVPAGAESEFNPIDSRDTWYFYRLGPRNLTLYYHKNASYGGYNVTLYTEIKGKTYSTRASGGKYEISYPYVEPGTVISYWFEPDRKYTTSNTFQIQIPKSNYKLKPKTIKYDEIDFDLTDNRTYDTESYDERSEVSRLSPEICALDVYINGVKKQSVNTSLLSQKIKAKGGDKLKVVFHDSAGYLYKGEYKIPKSKGAFSKVKCTTRKLSFVYNSKTKGIYPEKAYVKANGKKYKLNYISNNNKQSLNYRVKKNSSVTIYVENEDGIVIKKTVKAKEAKPKLSVNTLYSDQDTISGKTEKNLKVKIKIGKKKYTVKANKKGKFKKKIKGNKKNTKYSVSVKDNCDCTAVKNKKVKFRTASIGFFFRPTAGDKKVEILVDDVKKSDKLVLTVGKKKYTKKFKKNLSGDPYDMYKGAQVNFKTSKIKKGQKVKAVLKDKFGAVKARIKPYKVKKRKVVKVSGSPGYTVSGYFNGMYISGTVSASGHVSGYSSYHGHSTYF